MNPLYLTKASKHTLIGSTSAFLSFASKTNPDVRLFFTYILLGIIGCTAIALLWEGRQSATHQPSEEGLANLLSTLNNNPVKSKRDYLLTPQQRLEIVVALIIISIGALVGGI